MNVLVAGGGRLLLTTAMTLVHDAGGEYVFSDTDSLFVAATHITMNPVAVNIQCHSARRASAIITPGGIAFV